MCANQAQDLMDRDQDSFRCHLCGFHFDRAGKVIMEPEEDA